MILVDSSVWIDQFRGVSTPSSDRLDTLLGREPLPVGYLILTEVLQSFTSDRDYAVGHRPMTTLDVVTIGKATWRCGRRSICGRCGGWVLRYARRSIR